MLWQEQVQQLAAHHLVFLHECGVNTTMHRHYGRSSKGQRAIRAIGVVPRNWLGAEK